MKNSSLVIVLLAAATGGKVLAADPIFMSGFEPNTALSAPQNCWTASQMVGCWEALSGQDLSTGWSWGAPVWNSQTSYYGGSVPLLIADVPAATSSNIGSYLNNRLVTTRRHTGDWNNTAYYSEITEAKYGHNQMQTSISQNAFEFFPRTEDGDLYISYWVRFQPGMIQNMTGLNTSQVGSTTNGGTWRVLFELKTGTPAAAGDFPGDDGDYRMAVLMLTGCLDDLVNTGYEINGSVDSCANPNSVQPFWAVVGDNVAGGSYPSTNKWWAMNGVVPVPNDGSWNKVEIFWHRSSGNDGRFWFALNGTQVINHVGPNTGGHRDASNNPAPLPINRIFPTNLYTGGKFPVYQWMDDMQVWSTFPPSCTSTYWCDPPYAPH